jgi:hypothetical protein
MMAQARYVKILPMSDVGMAQAQMEEAMSAFTFAAMGADIDLYQAGKNLSQAIAELVSASIIQHGQDCHDDCYTVSRPQKETA